MAKHKLLFDLDKLFSLKTRHVADVIHDRSYISQLSVMA